MHSFSCFVLVSSIRVVLCVYVRDTNNMTGYTMAQEEGEMMIEHKQQLHSAIVTHGVIMGLAFAVVFPLGAILIRVASFRGLVWVHAAVQSLAYAMALAGMGLGVYIAVYPDSQVRYRHLQNTSNKLTEDGQCSTWRTTDTPSSELSS